MKIISINLQNQKFSINSSKKINYHNQQYDIAILIYIFNSHTLFIILSQFSKSIINSQGMNISAEENKPKRPLNAYFKFRRQRLAELKDDPNRVQIVKQEWNNIDEKLKTKMDNECKAEFEKWKQVNEAWEKKYGPKEARKKDQTLEKPEKMEKTLGAKANAQKKKKQEPQEQESQEEVKKVEKPKKVKENTLKKKKEEPQEEESQEEIKPSTKGRSKGKGDKKKTESKADKKK